MHKKHFQHSREAYGLALIEILEVEIYSLAVSALENTVVDGSIAVRARMNV